MTQEDKQLLLKVLCEQLPYGIKCTIKLTGYNDAYVIQGVYEDTVFIDCPVYGEGDGERMVESIIPYLRPMSSMTDEVRWELGKLCPDFEYLKLEEIDSCLKWVFVYDESGRFKMSWQEFNDIQDWLNAHHFDYRGLIEKGLALEAPEGMYKE